MPRNRRNKKPFNDEGYYNYVPDFQLGPSDNRESIVQCQQCTTILTYSHPQLGDLCSTCRRLNRNSKIRRGRRLGQVHVPPLQSTRIAPFEVSPINEIHDNIYPHNTALLQERLPVIEPWEQGICPTSSDAFEEDPNYFSFESSDRNDKVKFGNDLQICSPSNQGYRTVQIKPNNYSETRSSIFEPPVEDYPVLNEPQIHSKSTSTPSKPINQIHRKAAFTPSNPVKSLKRKENFEDVSLKRLRPSPSIESVPVDYDLTRSIWQYYIEYAQTEEIFNAKMALRTRLENIIQERFPGSELFVFGSSMTGYGSKTCDVDVSLMFHDLKVEKKDALNILWGLKSLFSRKRFLVKLQLIRARVPILKFKDTLSGFDIDLNINNPTGIRNSQLLRSYGRIDERVRPLILAIKLWARSHDINDARTGSLSSYCLGLMLIHYLQYRCFPPVLPSLQALQPDRYLPDADVRTLKMDEDLPLFRSCNDQSVGDLFAGFIRYFATEYDYRRSRISVRLGCLLKRAAQKQGKKNMLANYIDIEEPFELTNAARSAKSQKVYTYIKTVFNSSCNRLSQCGDIFSLCN